MKKILRDSLFQRRGGQPPETPPNPNPSEVPPQQPPQSTPTTPEELPQPDPSPQPGDATPHALLAPTYALSVSKYGYKRIVVIYGRPRRWLLRRHAHGQLPR